MIPMRRTAVLLGVLPLPLMGRPERTDGEPESGVRRSVAGWAPSPRGRFEMDSVSDLVGVTVVATMITWGWVTTREVRQLLLSPRRDPATRDEVIVLP